eukprot:g35834.t1
MEYPATLFIITSDFNQANLKNVLLRYCQHVSYPTRGPNALGHCYTTIKAYKQKLKHEDLVQNIVQCRSEGMDELLRDCLDWSIFKNSAANLNEHITTITDFISRGVQDNVPKKLIRVLPNRKPWMNWKTHSLLKYWSEVFKSGDPDLYRKS